MISVVCPDVLLGECGADDMLLRVEDPVTKAKENKQFIRIIVLEEL